MPTAFDRLLEIIEALNTEAVEYVLFGGQAVNVHGIGRFTDDIDLFVAPSEANVARLRLALRRVWDDSSIDEILAKDLAGEYAVVRYGSPDDFVIDIVSRLGETYTISDIESEIVRLHGVDVRVATPRMLYRMKRDTVRPVDRADALDLKAKFGIEEE